MKKCLIVSTLAVLLLMPVSLFASDSTATKSGLFWLGGHYTSISDFSRKVGEYDLGKDQLLPEFMLNYRAAGPRSAFGLYGHYYDHRNIMSLIDVSANNRLFAEVRYRSLTKQKEQDLLENLETREWLGTKAGGKILTHELADSGADYNIHRHEITSDIDMRLSQKNDIRMMVAHRSILCKGDEQQTGSTHCFSCHAVSNTRKTDRQTHQVETGLQADFGRITTGYAWNFRTTKDKGDPVLMHYDSAAHPVNGGSGAEFTSRQIFSDTTLPVGSSPETQKMSHKVRAKGDLGKGRWSSSLTYSQAKNADTDLKSSVYGAAVNYAYPLSPKSRLTVRLSAMRQKTDDTFIDLPLYREGRPGPQISFDYTRYSSLNRLDARGRAELTTRLSPKTTLAITASANRIKRDDYPYHGADYVTTKVAGQAKLRYRPTTKLSTTFAYKYEKTTNPFTSGRGLFEARGRDVLQPLAQNFAFIFYFQREALRYQTITTLPTDRHDFNLGGTLLASAKAIVNLNIKGTLDKNNDLDSLDVKRSVLQPAIDLTLTPNPKWSYTLGYSYDYQVSRLPVTVPLFDG